jgi:TP901 family phage tail tape measure protein
VAVIRNLVVKIGADINGLTKGLKSAQQQLDRVSKKMSKVGKSLTTAFTIPLVSFTALAIKSSSDVEASMLTIEKSFNATGKEMESLINVAKKMSSKTVYSINEVATAMNYLKSAGYSVAQMEKSLSTLTNLAVASNVELEQATTDVVKVLGQFNLGADKTDKVANVMSATMSKTSLTLDDLTTALSLVGKTSSSVGYSVEDTAGAIAMLSNAGFSAEKSGSYLKSVLLQLQSPTTEMIKVLDDLGLSVEDINPKTNSLSDILQKFADAGLMSSQATKMFGNEVDSAFMSLVGQGANSLNSLITSITDTNSAEEEAQKQLSTLSNQLKIIKNQLTELSIQFGEILLPIVKNFLSNTVMPLIEKFSNLSDKSKQLAIKIGAIVAAIGPAILIVAKLLKTMSALSGLFSMIVSPIGLVIMAIAAVIAILVTLYKTNEEFRAVVQSVWEKIKDIVTTVISDIKDFWDKHGKAIMEAVTKSF